MLTTRKSFYTVRLYIIKRIECNENILLKWLFLNLINLQDMLIVLLKSYNKV